MELIERQMKWLRSQIGESAETTDLQAAFDRLGSVRDVAIEVLRERRAQWLNQPMTVSVSGVASLSLAENVKAVERQIAELVKLDDDPSDDPGGGGIDGPGGAGHVLRTAVIPRPRRR